MTQRIDSLIHQVVRGEHVSKTPVWIMRQAGRYLPEFRAVRLQHDFFTLCRTPALATEVTLQPLRRYGSLLDASIIFSDILVLLQCIGLEVEMLEAKGPHLPRPIATPEDLQRLDLHVQVNDKLQYVYDAVKLVSQQIIVPLHGFVGAPWTLMAYAVEGGGSKQFSKIKAFMRTHNEAMHKMLAVLTRLCIDHLCEQVAAGATILQVFDSWAGELSPPDFQEFSLPYLRQIAIGVQSKLAENNHAQKVPIVVFAKGAHYAVELLCDSEYDIIGLDWTMDVVLTKSRVRKWLHENQNQRQRVTLQGSMDPTVLFAPADVIVREATRNVTDFLVNQETGELEQQIGYVCNLGHGIQPLVPVENVTTFLETVRDVSASLLAEQAKK